MALIIDGPDDLNQGTQTAVTDLVLNTGVGADIGLDSVSNGMPALAVGEFFEIRDHSVSGNNGLYKIVTVNTSTTSYEANKITGIAPVVAASEAATFFGATGIATEKSVHLDVDTNLFYLFEQGNLSADGTTMLAYHSFLKARWKDDQYLMDSARFPMVGISFAAGQWIFGQDPSGNNSGWKPAEDDVTNGIYTRQLFRNAGWDEVDASGVTQKKFFNVSTLGDFNAPTDQANYRFGSDATDLTAAVNYVYTDKVNEAVKYYENFANPDTCNFATTSTITRATGSFITDGYQVGSQVTVLLSTSNDGTYVITDVAALTITVTGTPFTVGLDTGASLSVDHSNAYTTYLRIQGKTFGQANLANAGETAISSKIIKFPLSNNADVDIIKADPVTGPVAGSGNYEDIKIRYFDQAFNREVDGATNRDFGICIDVGTHSVVDGSITAAGTVLTTAEGGMTIDAYLGGTLRLHEGTDENTQYTIASNTATTITISGGTFTATETNISATATLSSPLVVTRNEIYERIQYQLRQAADVDDTDQVITGNTTDALLSFVGADLKIGLGIPNNPNGGGSGVIIEGFDSNDTNNLYFTDNATNEYTYPFVAAGTFTFSQTLVDDSDGEYWLYFYYTDRVTGTTDISTVGNTGSTYNLVGTPLNVYAVNDYIRVGGFAQTENNGLFIVTVVNVSGSDYTLRKIDGTTVGTAETNQSASVDEHPYPSPGSIIVDNNDGPTPLTGAIGATSLGFNFDYDNNSQGGRTTGIASVVLVAAGEDQAQIAVVSGLQITRATGLSFSVTSPLERNYSNPI